jgi:hypothetical protein
MDISPERLDHLKRTLVAWAFGMETPLTVEAADQLIRTQIHPDLYATVSHLNGLLHQGGPALVRRVADRMGYTDVLSVFPQLHPIVDMYRSGEGDTDMLAQAYKEGLCLAAFFHQEILDRLFLTIYAHQVAEALHNHTQKLTKNGISSEAFWREYMEMQQRLSEMEVGKDERKPRKVMDILPALVGVQEEEGLEHYSIHGRLHLFDPLTRQYAVHLDIPRPRERFVITDDVIIPWQRIAESKGLLIELQVHERHAPERFHFTEDDLRALYARGSAIPLRMGKHGEARLYPEYVDRTHLLPGKGYTLPDHSLAHVRATRQCIEVAKLDFSTRLTVFV